MNDATSDLTADSTTDSAGLLYPLMLKLAGKPCLVVGGGPVAARRTRGLVEAGAEVRVVAPFACEEILELAAAGAITWDQREYASSDVRGSDLWLVHTATGEDTDAQVSADAEASRVWCVRADDARSSHAWTPAVARDGEVTVAVTGGGDPGLAKALRDAIAVGLAVGELPVRRTRNRESVGSVALVGGGPGHPELITVRGRRLLAQADVVITDRLGPRDLLDEIDAEIIDVGKTPGHHPMPQSTINDLLVEHAKRGRRVVRLKGGDPYVLGRGGEEALHCLANDVPVEVVPGVTSAISVPGAAGIPLTHRGITTSFVVASAHDGPDHVLAATRTAAADATLVLLMGVSLLEQTTEALVAAGRSSDTPAAIIERGWTPEQRVTVATLGTLAARAAEVGAASPAVVVIGEVVSLAGSLPVAAAVATS